MSLLWIEGFETFGTSDVAVTASLVRKYMKPLNVTWYCVLNPGRHFGKSLRIQSRPIPEEFSTPPFISTSIVFVGLALKVTYNNFGSDLIRFYEGDSIAHVGLRVTDFGRLQLNRANEVLSGASDPNTIMVGQWYYVEVKVVIHETAGAYEIRLNNNIVASASGLNTKNGGTGLIDRVNFRGWQSGSSHFVYYDDIYILDALGDVNNNFLGSQIVEAFYPTGDVQQVWTPSGGTVNAELIDENPANDDIDYVTSSLIGDKDIYSVGSLSHITGNIKGIQVNVDARVTETEARNLRTFLRINEDETHTGGSQSVDSTGYRTFAIQSEKNPDTLTLWQPEDISSLQCGLEHVE